MTRDQQKTGAANRKVEGVNVTADRIAAALVDRLVAVESQLAALRKEVSRNFDAFAEACPRLTADNKLRFAEVLKHNSEESDGFTVSVQVVEVAKEA